MNKKYGYTVASKSDLESITLPANYTISWSNDGSTGYVSGTGYGIGIEFHSAQALRTYIYVNGWIEPSNETV